MKAKAVGRWTLSPRERLPSSPSPSPRTRNFLSHFPTSFHLPTSIMASALATNYITRTNSASSIHLLQLNPSTLRLQRIASCASPRKKGHILSALNLHDDSGGAEIRGFCERREVLMATLGILGGTVWNAFNCGVSVASDFADMPALRGKDYGKSKMRFADYTQTESGLQYKDLRVGTGTTPNIGDTVVVDWDGYTIGYYGRIFEARNKTKGGSFEGDNKDFFKFKVGNQEVIPAFEEAITGMAPGGIRRIIVPPELGYPDNDYNKGAPKPTTFSGQRALAFVLRNQGLIDKTLLFDIELLKIVPSK